MLSIVFRRRPLRCHCNKPLNRLLDSAPTYRYEFQHRQSFLTGYADWVNGSHIDDIYSILGEPYMRAWRLLYLQADFDAVDTQISEHIMNYYSNFAHTGSVQNYNFN